MPELNELLSYEVGIRVTQAVTLLSTAEQFPDSEIEAALLGLESSSSRSCEQLRLAQPRLAQISRACVDCWMTRRNHEREESLLTEIQRRLNTASDNHITALEECHPLVSKWFRLGMAIAQGEDSTWSDGEPQTVPRQYPENTPREHRLPYYAVVLNNPVLPRWEWQDEPLIEELMNDLGQSRGRLFPERRALEEGECSQFSGLPFRHFWGWNAIELGLRSLVETRIRPFWNRETRTLYFGDRVLRRYSSQADNQMAILDAFQAAGWQDSIHCPITHPRTARQTIDDMTRTLADGPIHFHGGITGVSWDIRSVSEI